MARACLIAFAATALFHLSYAGADTASDDTALLERALAKQDAALEGLAYTVHYKSDIWGTEFTARYTPGDDDTPWELLTPTDRTPEQTERIMARIVDDELQGASILLSEDDAEDGYPDLKISESDGNHVYDFKTELDIDGRKKPIKDRARTSIFVDPVSELVTRVRVYSDKGFRISTIARAKSLETETLFTSIDGLDAAIALSHRSDIKGKALLVTDWSMDYTATYSDFALPE